MNLLGGFARRLQAQWGLSLLGLLSLLAFVRLLRQDVPGHYRVFTSAAHALWTGHFAYGTDFGTQVGYFFYSPSCALFFFGPFSCLPEKLGLTLYMLLSWGVFVWGAKQFYQKFASSTASPMLQWFWVAVSPQVFGAILASKLELLMVGLILAAISWLTPSSHISEVSVKPLPLTNPLLDTKNFAAAALLALTLNWKFQPLPLIGLAMIAWVYVRRDWKIPLTLVASLGVFYLLPFAFLPREFLLQNQQVWSETFSKFVGESVLNFENVFRFLNHAFGVPISFATSQLISMAVGAGLAVFLVAWLVRRAHSLRGGLLLSSALGSMFMTAFSPLGQNNAMVLYAPLLLSGFICLAGAFAESRTVTSEPSIGATPRGAVSHCSRRWIITLVLVFAVMTLSYSDLVPLTVRNQLRFLSIKPLACLALGAAIALEAWRKRGWFSRSLVN